MSVEPEERGFLDQFRSNSDTLREIFAEFLGTFVLTLCGNAVGAVVVFQGASSVSLIVGPLSWGFAVAFAIYIAGGPAGAHLNPAVTLALATVGKCKWSKIIHYMLAQYLGAFVSAAVLFGVYHESFTKFDGGDRASAFNVTAGIFSCYPKDHVGTLACFWDQILGTGLLLIAVLAITDDKNMKVTTGQQPLAIGFSLAIIIMAFGYNCGAPLNPARDLGPRALTAIAGWGAEVFSYRQYNWFWVPIVGPYLGAIVGAWVYKLMVAIHWPLEITEIRDEIRVPQWKHEHINTISEGRVSNHDYTH